LEVPVELKGLTDPTTWGKLGTLQEIENPSKKDLDTLIGTAIAVWNLRGMFGKVLWNHFQDLFENWDRATWNKASNPSAKLMMKTLMNGGVFVTHAYHYSGVTSHLVEAATRHRFRVWTLPEIKDWAGKSDVFKQRINNKAKVIEIRERHQDQERREHQQRREDQQRPDQEQQRRDQKQQSRDQDQERHDYYLRNTVNPANPAYQFRDGTPLWYVAPTGRQILDFEKLYSGNDDVKFSGNFYDVFETKLQIFHDNRERLGIPEGCSAGLFPSMLKGKAKEYYYNDLFRSTDRKDFELLVRKFGIHFNTEEGHQFYLSEWRSTTLQKVIGDNPGKTRLECLDLLFDKLGKLQQAIPSIAQDQRTLRDQALNACKGIPECSMALYNPALEYEGVRNQLRNAISITQSTIPQQFTVDTAKPDDSGQAWWTDRKFRGRGRDNRYGRGGGHRKPYRRPRDPNTTPKCYVCGKEGCWSSKHPQQERREAYERYKRGASKHDTSYQAYSQYVVWHEGGLPSLDDTVNPDEALIDQFFQSDDDESEQDSDEEGTDSHYVSDTFFTETPKPVDGPKVATLLNDASVRHYFTHEDPYNTKYALIEKHDDPTVGVSTMYLLDDRYSSGAFHGIMPDTGAAGHSTAGEPQFRALQRMVPSATLDTNVAKASIRFGSGEPIT
ncbi:hypothetical protein QBC37DRAFT_245561, partial [Rhypophila decipiens]